MKTWQQAWNDGLMSGAIGSLASTAALSMAGQRETGSALGPINVISRWILGAGLGEPAMACFCDYRLTPYRLQPG